MFTVDSARALLNAAGVFFGKDDEQDHDEMDQTLNLNDSLYWACSYGEYVADSELPEVAQLFWLYGWPGIIYWVLKKQETDKVEFVDVNRQVEYVRNEEAIRMECPSSSKRAYLKRKYTIGEE